MRIRARRPPDRLDETGTATVETPSEEEAGRPSLVSLLVEAGVASESELRELAGEADAQGIRLGELVVARDLLDEEGMGRLVAHQWGLPFLARGSLTIDPVAAGLLPFEQARTLHGCVIGIRERSPLVVVADPSSERLDALRTQVETTPGQASVSFAVVTASSLQGLLGQLARLSGRRPDPAPDRSHLARTPQTANGDRPEQIASRPTSSDQLLADLQRAAATEQTLQARLDQLTSEREAADEQIEQLRHQVEELQQQLEAADQRQTSEREPDSELQARLDQLESERETADQQIEQLQHQIEELQQQLEAADREIDQLQHRIEQLQAQLAAVDRQRVSERDHGSQLQARLDQMESERETADEQIERLRQQVEAADQQQASERDHSSELQTRLDRLESERETADQQIEQLHHQIAELQRQLAAADHHQTSERDRGSELQVRLDQLERDRTAAEQQVEQLQQQLAAADQQRASEREAADQQIEQLRQQLAAADRQRASERAPDSEPQARPDRRRNHRKPRDHELRREIHELLTQPDGTNPTTSGETAGEVSRINVRLLEGVFSQDERRQLAKGLIKAVVGVKGESFRNETEVLIAEVPVGNRHEREATITPEGVDEPG